MITILAMIMTTLVIVIMSAIRWNGQGLGIEGLGFGFQACWAWGSLKQQCTKVTSGGG